MSTYIAHTNHGTGRVVRRSKRLSLSAKKNRSALGDISNRNAKNNNGVKKQQSQSQSQSQTGFAMVRTSAQADIRLNATGSRASAMILEDTAAPVPASHHQQQSNMSSQDAFVCSQQSFASQMDVDQSDDLAMQEQFDLESIQSVETGSVQMDVEPELGADFGANAVVFYDPIDEYAEDVFQWLRLVEAKGTYQPRAYLPLQRDLSAGMRSILVDWLVEVTDEYRLKQQSLFLAINYLDRFLSVVEVHRTRLQLVGVTAMLVAAKYEEIYPPSVDEFVYISDNTYTRDEVLEMETTILQYLDFKLTAPTPYDFLDRFNRGLGLSSVTLCLAQCLIEKFAVEADYIHFTPLVVTTTAVMLAQAMTHCAPWTPEFERLSCVNVLQVSHCAERMHAAYVKLVSGQQKLKAVYEKYASPAKHSVVQIPCLTQLPQLRSHFHS